MQTLVTNLVPDGDILAFFFAINQGQKNLLMKYGSLQSNFQCSSLAEAYMPKMSLTSFDCGLCRFGLGLVWGFLCGWVGWLFWLGFGWVFIFPCCFLGFFF